MSEKTESQYALEAAASDVFDAPVLPYQPPKPKSYQPRIGLIGCGGITKTHLGAYVKQGYNVVALCDKREDQARLRADEFYPDAEIFTDSAALLAREDIDVVDIATHPPERVPLIKSALEAGKHVLSQKPFVLDLDTGEELVALADQMGCKIAVNQNGRWAPHFSYIREAIRAGLVGEVTSSHLQVHWDHSWVKGTPFARMRDLILYDFAIHWFDATASFWPEKQATRIFASKTTVGGQAEDLPPMAAQILLEYQGGQASLVFDAHTPFGAEDHTYIGGTLGSLVSTGPGLGDQTVSLFTKDGKATPGLEGSWFPDGFAGTMGELLCAIEDGREPQNSARSNLKSLELAFAAIESTETGLPQVPGQVRRLPEGSVPLVTVGTR